MIFIKLKNGKHLFFSIKTKIFFVLINIIYILLIEQTRNNYIQNKNIKIALCTMGKNENLYAKEFVEYYLKIGVDHIMILNLKKFLML